MADTVVIPDSGEDGAVLEEQAAHDAAVAEGASMVHEQQAAEHAAEAEAAADAALAAAEANAAVVEQISQAAATAEASATDAGYSRDAVLEALAAQTTALNSLTEELRAGRKAAEPAKDKPKSTPDKPPARERKGSWYYGG
jgi:hypothetical protein